MNNPLIEDLRSLFRRDLEKLKLEIESFKKEENIWAVQGDIINPAGNLCLHLVGNLKTFIGNDLGQSGYVRKRDLEFSLKDVSRETLIQQVNETIEEVDNTLKNLNPDTLDQDSSRVIFNEKMTNRWFLIHLASHLSYHLGQINYHRRLLDQ